MGAGASKTAVAAAQHAAAAAARSARRAPPDASLVRSTADSRDVARRAGAPLAGVAATADAPYAAPATAPTGASPLEAEARALLERVNRRPALHRRLDDDSGDAGAAAPVVDGGGVARTVPGDAAAEDVEALWRGRRLADDEAAGVQAAAEGAPGAAAGSDGAVVVRRVRGSSATDTLSDADREALHAKSPATSAGAAALGDGITEAPGDAAGASALAVWDAMQLNPALLDSAAALSRSHVQAAFAALALGVSPDAARLTASSQRRAELTAGSVNSGGGGGAVQSGGGSAASGAPSAPPSALVPLSPEAMDALVPANSSLDTLMLARPPPAGVVAWGHRPPEGSPYDQLILHDADEESRLERGELFEMFARHRADPAYWTPDRLAQYYDTKPEWVAAILDSVSPPVYVAVDGAAYGVVAMRPMAAFDADAAADAAEEAAAAAARRAAGADGDDDGDDAAPPSFASLSAATAAGARPTTLADAQRVADREQRRRGFVGARKVMSTP